MQATTATLVGLFIFESMPLSLIGGCLAANFTYYLVMKTFPFIELTSPVLIVSVGEFRIFVSIQLDEVNMFYHLNFVVDKSDVLCILILLCSFSNESTVCFDNLLLQYVL